MAGLRVLVSGASVAGPVVAHWLNEAGAKVTVIERASDLRGGGQSVDIRGHGVTIMNRMGLLDTVRANTTHEKGLRFVDTNGVIQAEFAVTEGEQRLEFTADIEILRGRLAKVLFEATKDKVRYRFGTKIQDIQKEGASAVVTLIENGSETKETFDLVVAADGQSSTTRAIALANTDCTVNIRSLNQWTSWFGLPRMEQDPNWWNWFNAPGRRMLHTRPDDSSNRGGMSIIGHSQEMKQILQQDSSAQKAKWRELFSDAGWRAKEILDGMDKADDFYMQEVVQIKLDKYHNYDEKKTVFVGDAGYAPSPISGMGTTLAITGAYILAGEVAQAMASSSSSSPVDLGRACELYEEKIKPLVTKAQALPPGVPAIANPDTAWGIRIFHTCLWVASWPTISKIFSMFGGGNPPASAIKLPEYEFS